jgi:hypothetical protein
MDCVGRVGIYLWRRVVVCRKIERSLVFMVVLDWAGAFGFPWSPKRLLPLTTDVTFDSSGFYARIIPVLQGTLEHHVLFLHKSNPMQLTSRKSVHSTRGLSRRETSKVCIHNNLQNQQEKCSDNNHAFQSTLDLPPNSIKKIALPFLPGSPIFLFLLCSPFCCLCCWSPCQSVL